MFCPSLKRYTERKRLKITGTLKVLQQDHFTPNIQIEDFQMKEAADETHSNSIEDTARIKDMKRKDLSLMEETEI